MPRSSAGAPSATSSHALIHAPTGSGKTLAAFLWCLDRLMTEAPPARKTVRVLYISPLKALAYDVERNLRAPLAGIRRTAERLGQAVPEISVGSPDRGHAGRGSPAADEDATGHPGHDAGVAVPAAHQPGARDAARGRARHRRRGARHRRHEAWLAPRAEPRAPQPPGRCGPAAHRPVGDPAAARGDRRVPRRSGPRGGNRRCRRAQGARPRGDRAGRGHGAHGRGDRGRRGARRAGGRARGAALDLAVDPPAAARAHPDASVHPDLRQLATAGGAAGGPAQRAGRRGAGARPSRQRGARAAARDRGAAEAGQPAGAGGDQQPRARDRHGSHRPRRPDRVTTVGRVGHAAHRSRRATRSASRRPARSFPSSAATWSRRRSLSSA